MPSKKLLKIVEDWEQRGVTPYAMDVLDALVDDGYSYSITSYPEPRRGKYCVTVRKPYDEDKEQPNPRQHAWTESGDNFSEVVFNVTMRSLER